MPDLRVRALQLLTRRDYSRAEAKSWPRMPNRRRTRGVLDTLQGERLLSDHRYATQRVTARAGRYGDARLRRNCA
jgi:regulatory protein